MLRRFFRYYRPYRRLFVLDFGCAVLAGVLELSFPVIVNRTIDTILPQGSFALVLWVVAGLLALYLSTTALKYIVVYQGHRLGVLIENDMRRELYDRLQRQSFRFFDQRKTGELVSRLTTDLFDVSETAHHGPEEVFLTVMTLGASLWLMLQVHPLLAWITVILVPILAVTVAVFNKRMTRINRTIYQNLGQFHAAIANKMSGIRLVQAFANEAHEQQEFNRLLHEYQQNKLAFYRTMAHSATTNYLLMRLTNLFALLFGAYFTLNGSLTIGQLVGFILLTNVFVRPIESLNMMLELYPKGYAGFSRFCELLDEPLDIVDAPDAVAAPALRGAIAYEDVSFAYRSEQPVLSHLNLSIAAGETVAFVGPSGSGKTTLCHLLPRFYERIGGRITIDGYPIEQFTLASLRRQIGVVQQDVFLFAGTIRDNVRYGRLDADDAEIAEALRRAHLSEWLATLPDGMDTEIGERGVQLSGGQKQRLAIARIFLKNPPILILDEATSALDTQTEQLIQASFAELAQGRTTLIIAHRLATIQNADRIVVLTPEGVVSQGTHQQLMAERQLYYELYTAQFGAHEEEQKNGII